LTTLGVVAALAAEARALGRATRKGGASASFGNLAFLSDGSIVAVSGVGMNAAAAAARKLIDAGVSALMTFGMAGGLDPSLTAGGIVIPDEVLSRDGARYPSNDPWKTLLRHNLSAHGPICGGALLTSPTAIDSLEAKAQAFRSTQAVAVDMESAAVAAVAAEHGLPFLSVRAIIDTANDALPRSVVAASREGRVRIGRLVRGLLASPQDIGPLWQLTVRYRVAMRALSAVARLGSLAPAQA
jgi:adenosylhomocysteine nucleosidase